MDPVAASHYQGCLGGFPLDLRQGGHMGSCSRPGLWGGGQGRGGGTVLREPGVGGGGPVGKGPGSVWGF